MHLFWELNDLVDSSLPCAHYWRCEQNFCSLLVYVVGVCSSEEGKPGQESTWKPATPARSPPGNWWFDVPTSVSEPENRLTCSPAFVVNFCLKFQQWTPGNWGCQNQQKRITIIVKGVYNLWMGQSNSNQFLLIFQFSVDFNSSKKDSVST